MMYDVVVVGGGLSGLAAASALQSESPSSPPPRVLLVEARDRLGGRTFTVDAGLPAACCGARPLTVDVGGQWVGATHSRVLQLVQDCGLRLEEQEFTPPSPMEHRHCSLIECAHCPLMATSSHGNDDVERFIAWVDAAAAGMDTSDPWTHPNAQEWNTQSAATVIHAFTTNADAVAELLLFVQTVLAVAPDAVSFFFFVFYVASSGGMESLGDGDQGAQRYRVVGGAQQVATRLADRLGGGGGGSSCSNGHVALGHRVVRIDQHEHEHEQEEEARDNAVVVTCLTTSGAGNVSFRARRVIFAASPSLIATQRIAFAPPLPDAVAALCSAMSMGRCVKAVAVYAEPFWTVNSGPPRCASVRDALSTAFGPFHNVFVSRVCCRPALVLLSTGQPAVALAALPPDAQKEAAVAQLARMYGTAEARAPLALIVEDWQRSPFSAGCYAGVYPPGAPWAPWPTLRTPHGHVHFAGTETSPEFYGYMEGAVRSGQRAAADVWRSLLRG
jgi:monoamine oxidase